MKRKPLNFKTSKRIIESGIITTNDNLRVHVFLSETREIISSAELSNDDKLKAIVLFFEDVFENIKRIGDFVNYGIGEYPVSYCGISNNDILRFNRSRSVVSFNDRLSILKKEYYDMMLEYINETE